MSHIILLVQPIKKREGNTYSTAFESVNECLEAVCNIYEEHLRRLNPNSSEIEYEIGQLLEYIDNIEDVSCLVYQEDTRTYAPHNKDWIKDKIYNLRKEEEEAKQS